MSEPTDQIEKKPDLVIGGEDRADLIELIETAEDSIYKAFSAVQESWKYLCPIPPKGTDDE